MYVHVCTETGRGVEGKGREGRGGEGGWQGYHCHLYYDITIDKDLREKVLCDTSKEKLKKPSLQPISIGTLRRKCPGRFRKIKIKRGNTSAHI